MSTTAARIPAFRQCILPAGWDMARPPAVPGRALARPQRAPVGPAPRAPRRPFPAPAPRPPAARLSWAPPRLGAPRGSGDRALTSRRPSASPRSPPDGRRPLPQRRHFQGSLSGCGPDGRLRGSCSDAPPAPGPRPGPASRAPAQAPRLRAVQAARPPAEGGGPLALSAPGGSAPRSPSGLRRGSLPSPPGGQPPPLLSPLPLRPLLCAPPSPPPLAGPRAPSPGKGG